MGKVSIGFKPSTILIFSIYFGLVSDPTVCFLTSCRQQFERGLDPLVALTKAIYKSGTYLIYNALAVSVGLAVFAVFAFGDGCTEVLVVRMACLTNLVLLPVALSGSTN